ncbi:MAG: ATP-dependent helicase [Phycisphaerales bacterium]|nr:ATP-dependent helicase [Phycisphaerales bacterium]
MSTAFHAKYFSHELTGQAAAADIQRLSTALFDACVDLNPHQIDAALFALRSPLSKGVLLADEVGLGKTIEAGLLLCQFWAERRRRLLVICPASIRKQWSLELSEKFSLPNSILDASSYRLAQREGNPRPFDRPSVVICSMNFASRLAPEVRSIAWDLVVIDEAHQLRGAYRPSNKMGQAIREATEGRRKVLLTATPLQNSLLELYGLSTLIDEHTFGELPSFRSQFMSSNGDLPGLKARLRSFCQRTLRRQVVEYIQYTERRPMTRPFQPTKEELRLYDAVSAYLQRDDSYGIPPRQRQLITLILRKLLASSSRAVAGTLNAVKGRLLTLREGLPDDPETLFDQLAVSEDLEEVYADDESEPDGESSPTPNTPAQINRAKLDSEIEEVDRFIRWALGIGIDTKSRALHAALEIGLREMQKVGAARKALIFTESRRTQAYLKEFLEGNGYSDQIVLFNGSNNDTDSRRIYEKWRETNAATGRTTGSRDVDMRAAIVEHFRDNATLMIATEAGATGINLQFCSLVINYELPWNPQRIEQRIGRCHRYGQKHDVVVINFLNERNEADRRVLELLHEKFQLFSGVFGASDEVLGTVDSGVDFEKRILAIYQQCRTPEQIDAAFRQLQLEMEETIRTRIDDTRRALLEHFDEEVHARLRVHLNSAREQLDRVGRLFWTVTGFILAEHAGFDDADLSFELRIAPRPDIRCGRYRLISKTRENVLGEFLYRISHPLGEFVIDTAKAISTPPAAVMFDVTHYPTRIAMVEAIRGRSGWLTLQRLVIESFERADHLLFSAFDDGGAALDQETCVKLFSCTAGVQPLGEVPASIQQRLDAEAARHREATITRSLELNHKFFQEERERLEKWADDMVVAAEKELAGTKAQIKALSREARLATTTDEQHAIQQKIADLEHVKRRQRQRIFDVEDEIIAQRDTLVARLEQRMAQRTTAETLFTIRWSVV